MQLAERVKRASIAADSAFEFLDNHKREFAGTEWMPANFFQRRRITYILKRMEDLYDEVEAIDFKGLPGQAHMEKDRYRMWKDLRMAHRWQVKDHMRFLDHVSEILLNARSILERLRRLAVLGQIVRTGPDTSTHAPDTLLD